MGRKRLRKTLRDLLNYRLVGHLKKEAGGAVEFRYDGGWLSRERAIPVSLSLPLREEAYRGAAVAAVFDNLLPDSEALRRRIAAKVAAEGHDFFSLLSRIGRDCAGALQFVPEDDDETRDATVIDGEPAGHEEVGRLLHSLATSPLGLAAEGGFRISVAGAQEKTARFMRTDGGNRAAPRRQPTSSNHRSPLCQTAFISRGVSKMSGIA